MKNKNKKQYMAALAVLIMTLMIASGLANATKITDDGNDNNSTVGVLTLQSEEFYSKTSDGEIQRIEYIGLGGSSYANVRNAKEGNFAYRSEKYICFGQDFIGPPAAVFDCGVYRGFLFFDTSDLPDDAVVKSASLDICGRKVSEMDKHFDIWLQKGTSGHPTTSLNMDDYNYKHYQDSPNGLETFNTKSFQHSETSAKHNVINLNSDGMSWIKTDDFTKFCLRSSRDVNSKYDNTNEWISIWSSEKGGEYRPKLTVGAKLSSNSTY